MALNLNQVVALTADTTFQSQVRAAAVSYAHTVLNEVASSHATLQNMRWAFAAAILADGCTAMLTRVNWGLATTPGFSAVVNDTTDANDAAINSAMISQWNTLALINTQQQTN